MKQADIGVMHLQAKEYQGLLAASHQKPAERHGMYSPSEPLKGTNSADTLIADF